MTPVRHVAYWVSLQIDEMVAAVVAVVAVVRPRRKIEFVEKSGNVFSVRAARGRSRWRTLDSPMRLTADGGLEQTDPELATLICGGEVEIVLLAERFISRPLDLPKQASKFLAGIVRAQIDRLAPWPTGEVVFGCSEPLELNNDRISVNVVTAAREQILPIVQRIADLRAGSILVSTSLGADAPRIRIFESHPSPERKSRRVRNAIIAVPVLSGVAAILATVAWNLVEPGLEAHRLELAKGLADRRSPVWGSRLSDADKASDALEKKKRETPPTVIVIETLSKSLPDDTYLTELRIEDRKIQISGMTRDAPSLVSILEETHQFTHATFFAPTTRTSMESREHFHIEAHLEPYFSKLP
jgi:general secretion pathway protein L